MPDGPGCNEENGSIITGCRLQDVMNSPEIESKLGPPGFMRKEK